MPRSRPYSASQTSLYRPAQADDFFETGVPSTMAGLCAELSRLAYCSDERVCEIATKVGATTCAPFHIRGTHAFRIEFPARDATVLVFRGTESDLQNYQTDAKFWKTPWLTGGAVHSGFSQALLEIWPLLESNLKSVVGQMVFTGHSLGAALATLAATLVQPQQVITYGSPHVGDSDFAQTLRPIQIHRYINCCDFITQIPPERFGFTPVGTPHYINAAGELLIDPSYDLIRADRSSARFRYLREYALKLGNVPIRDLADHAPINYVSALPM